MVFVFGIDLPLVEMIFILTLINIAILGLLIYVIINQVKLNKKLKGLLDEEEIELRDLKNIQRAEKNEVELLKLIRSKLDKTLYVERVENLIKQKYSSGKGTKNKGNMKEMAASFWMDLIKMTEKSKKEEYDKKLKVKRSQLDTELMIIERERMKLESEKGRLEEEKKKQLMAYGETYKEHEKEKGLSSELREKRKKIDEELEIIEKEKHKLEKTKQLINQQNRKQIESTKLHRAD